MTQPFVVSYSRLKVIGEEQKDGSVCYTFNGSVDDSFVFKDLKMSTVPNVIFDLAQVQHINSMGTREWILMLRQFHQTSHIHYRHCSVAMVDAFNSVPQLYQLVTIDSFMAPYFCPQCQTELTLSITVHEHLAELKKGVAPMLTHSTCGQHLEFDALEESYFGFLKSI